MSTYGDGTLEVLCESTVGRSVSLGRQIESWRYARLLGCSIIEIYAALGLRSRR